MSNNVDSKAVTVSVKIYEHLLSTCPADFRREYGPAMKQLFRDQCRDAWSAAQGRGLAIVWLRALPDLAKTSLVQHLANRANSGPRATFGRVFAVAFVCVVLFSICQMFWTPKVYSSTTRIEVLKDPPQILGGSNPYFLVAQYKMLKSVSILTNVIATLHLDDKLAAQSGGTHWTMDQTYQALMDKVSVKQTRMTNLFEISVKNGDPKLAADIANAIVVAYREWCLERRREDRDRIIAQWHLAPQAIHPLPAREPIIIRDPARPIVRPFYSGSYIFSRWMFGGTVAALMAGGVGAWITYLIRRPNGIDKPA